MTSYKLRMLIGIVIGVAYGALTYTLLAWQGAAAQGLDFTYPWLAAKAIVSGVDPYSYVARAPTPFVHALFYPLPAGIIALPFAWMPARLAGAVFVAIGACLLAIVITGRDLWRALIFLSAPAYQVAYSVQWAPVFMAGAVWPALLGLSVAKPNLLLPLLAYQTRRRAFVAFAIGAGLLLVASLAIEPAWPILWLRAIRSNSASGQYRVPLLSPWGWPILLAAAAIRQREARLLLALACVPQNFFFYDQFLLLLVPTTRIATIAIAATSWLAYGLWPGGSRAPENVTTWTALSRSWEPRAMVGLYYPALVVVLITWYQSLHVSRRETRDAV